MAIKGWDNPLFKYVVRDSFNRADTITTTTGAVVLLIAAHIVGIEGKQNALRGRVYSIRANCSRRLCCDLACYNALPSVLVAILLAIEAAWGLAKFSPREAGDVYVAGNIDSERFGGGPLLTGGGLIWLSFKMLSGAPTAAQAGEPRRDIVAHEVKGNTVLRNWSPDAGRERRSRMLGN